MKCFGDGDLLGLGDAPGPERFPARSANFSFPEQLSENLETEV